MNLIRIILSTLYIITMVLLPYGHMFMHVADSAESACQHGCSHHPAPEPELPPQPDSHEDCSLCQLILLPAEVPSLFTIHEQTVYLSLLCERPIEFIGVTIAAPHKARAPPFAAA